MGVGRIIAIIVVYLLACAGWMVLGTTTALRSDGFASVLRQEVRALWGGELVQDPPRLRDSATKAVALAASTIAVDLDLEHRRKGLVWYPTYTCRFDASYVVANPGAAPVVYDLDLGLPDAEATYHDVVLQVDGADLAAGSDPRDGIQARIELAPGQVRELRLAYRTRGLRSWRYRPGTHLGRVRDFDLTVRTDFAAYDFPDDGIAAHATTLGDDGATLRWTTPEMITSRSIGVVVPERLNPGPLSARMTFFAPVCLGFFFLILATVTVVRGAAIHPMHYAFVAGGFVAFHLLFAYLVDLVPLHLSFAIAAVTSVVLVTAYLRAAIGPSLPTLWVAAGQLCFLVLFSYSFFIEGATGLTVAIGSVLFLGFLMWITAKVDWAAFFRRSGPPSRTRGPATTVAPAAE